MRQVRFPDVTICYRLNRGDIQTIREVWIKETYRLPRHAKPEVVVDLGANIGMTSVFLARRHGARYLVAVEPLPENAGLASTNLSLNGVDATVIEAAVGANDGVGYFAAHPDSNLGQVANEGEKVNLLSIDSVLAASPTGRADLLKMDIEGGETAVLEGDTSWLERVDSLIVEFHPHVADYAALVRTIEAKGFRHFSGGTLRPGPLTDYFERR
jgi:FkbM family methyltransferase